jgi:hypothetical protein
MLIFPKIENFVINEHLNNFTIRSVVPKKALANLMWLKMRAIKEMQFYFQRFSRKKHNSVYLL